MYNTRCLKIVNKLYISAGKCENQQQYKAIIEAEIFSTREIFTEISTMSPGPFLTIRNISERKSLHQFTEVLDDKKKNAFQRVGFTKSGCKAIIAGSILWSIITKKIGHTKINEWVKKYLYIWIIQHPHILQSPIVNYCLKVPIRGHSKPQLVSKNLLQLSVW